MGTQTQRILARALFALLLLWGGWTLLLYIAVPVHQLVLLSETDRSYVQQVCEGSGPLCQGWYGFLPFLRYALHWAQPFLWYGIVSFVAMTFFVGWRYMQRGEWRVRVTVRPWHILLLFLGSLWLVFMVVALGKDNGNPMRRIVEPLPQVYENASPEVLASLKENFEGLSARGCLEYVGRAQIGADVFDVRIACMQTAFLTRVLAQVALVLLFLLELLILGRLFLSLLRVRMLHPLAEFVLSLGAGACCLIALVWLLAVLWIYTTLAGWILALAIPAVGYRHALYWIRRFSTAQWQVDEKPWSIVFLLMWLLLGYLAFNFLSVVRPFPIGWDDLGRYLNHPRLLVSYGHFIPPMSTFQWEYVTSLAFRLFGYDAVTGSTFALMINWTEGLMAVLAVYALARVFLGPRQGLLAALLYYTLPLVGHFSFADMKVDNAVFTMGTLSVLSFFLAFFPMHAEGDEVIEYPFDWRWMVLAGFFGGFAFSMKPTAIMVVMALSTMLFGVALHWTAFVGAVFLAWAFYTFHGEFDVRAVSQYVYGDPTVISRPLVYALCVGLGLLFFGFAVWRHRERFIPSARIFGVFVASLIAAMLPWLLYNNVQHGRIIPKLVMGTPDYISPVFEIVPVTVAHEGQDVRVLTAELRPDMKHPACQSTSRQEEVDRYWGGGFGKGWGHYVTLPFRSVMNLDSAGYYVTTFPALLLFPLVFLVPLLWTRRGRAPRWLALGTLFMLVQWMFFANGIPWYGIGVFLGIVIALEVLATHAPGRWTRRLTGVFLVLSLLTAYDMRFWQYEQQQNLYEYPMGKVSAEAIRKRTIPHYDVIRDLVVERHDTMPDRPYVYRVGTFIPYFIPRSLEYLPMTDNQLDFFNCLNQERDAALTLKRLKAFGFSSIIFDTNTHTIEKDQNGTLHKKVQAFLDFVNTPALGLQIMINDPDGGVAFVLIP